MFSDIIIGEKEKRKINDKMKISQNWSRKTRFISFTKMQDKYDSCFTPITWNERKIDENDYSLLMV